MLSAAASGMGLFFLSQCASRTDGRHASFFAISKLTWPGMAIFFDLAIAIKCFGVAVSYLIIIGDLMPQVGVTHAELYMSIWPCVTLKGGCFILGLCSRSYIDWSTILDHCIYGECYFAIEFLEKAGLSQIYQPCRIDCCHLPLHHCSLLLLFNLQSCSSSSYRIRYFFFGLFQSITSLCFRFYLSSKRKWFKTHSSTSLSHSYRKIFSVYNELKDNSQRQVNSVIAYSIGTACTVYEAIGILGYLTFGKSVLGNIILECKLDWIIVSIY